MGLGRLGKIDLLSMEKKKGVVLNRYLTESPKLSVLYITNSDSVV